ncbi:MAG TPA: ChbG/HpnK family deacetylase [Gemmataceae bacterium]|nr:ChbG/HpnK family deacetylase [Gemmataceae bacterium]
MKYLIVNGDDFGAGQGINRGILEAHRRGILTSTSLMVDMPASQEAVAQARDCPGLNIGLHTRLTDEREQPVVDLDDPGRCRAELDRQFARFRELTGGPPTHLDSHHNIHRDPRVLPLFLDLGREHGVPLRGHSPARYFSNFYGQWNGESHLEWIGVENLLRMLEAEVRHGVTELSCHPGYVDADFPTLYAAEREAELRTLCDPAVRRALDERDIRLVGFRDLGRLPAGPPD